jgi:NAD(P)-dependent dehydrogenase (short-subunit alcohol dehydrogenase family)
MCVSRSEEHLAETVAAIAAAGGRGELLATDLRGEEPIGSVVAATVERLGGLDILVNNAADDHDSSVIDTDLAVWQRVVELNLESCFLLCKAAGPHILAGGHGKVINVGSVLAHVAVRNNAAYIAAKSGLLGLTRGLALEWAPKGAQVNLLCPGFIRTEMTAGLWETDEGTDWVVKRTPMGRWGAPVDLVGPAVFLASPASDFMTGQSLVIDGGWTVH